MKQDEEKLGSTVDSTPSVSIKSKKKVVRKPVASKTSTKEKPKSAKRAFPLASLEDSLKIGVAIKDYNAGNPWSPKDISETLKMGMGNNFFYLAAGSRDYGITVGTRDADKIEISGLGKGILYPKNPREEIDSLNEAFRSVDLFKKVYDYYQGKNLPEIKYLKNTLKTEFGLDEKVQDEFYRIFQINLTFLNSKSQSLGVGSDNIVEVSGGSSIIIGESAAPGGLIAFVAMPFSEKTSNYAKGYFDEVLKHLITPAAVKAKFTAKTAKKAGSEVIQATIVNDLDSADLVIVDLTEHNPNVLFELGMRIAFNKPVCLIRARGTAPIFDIDHMLRVYDYNSCLWASTLEIDIPALSEHISETWKNKSADGTYLNILRSGKSNR